MLSVCTVFRDHRDTLGRCLRSAVAIAGELVAVDTGAVDGSDELARECGARVESFPWRDDIAAARNAALEHARGEWILFLDADDELLTPDEVPPLTRQDEVWGWILRLEHAGTAEQAYGEALRLYRAGLRYEGIIHEHLIIPPDWELRRAPQVRIRHTGFSEETLARERKAERNLRLGLLELQRAPGDTRALARAAKCFLSAGRSAEALEHYLKALALAPRDHTHEAECYLGATVAAQRLPDHALAARIGGRGLARYPDYVDLLCLVGWSCLQVGDVAAARRHLLQAVFCFDRLGAYPLSGSVTLPRVMEVLAGLPPG